MLEATDNFYVNFYSPGTFFKTFRLRPA